ncbi:hypothetical protein F5887DRAFT_674047 [Amanita rubescens]|nr:hypothetical protein F5887DRAFT_674047 [Amanita rubescens]
MNRTCEVPTEVLSRIFHFLCDDPINIAPQHNEYDGDFPWAVGRVCRRWRSGFISYPPIWTSISFQDFFTRKGQSDEAIRRLSIFLERSGALPLDITLGLCRDASRPALRLILACSHRWRTAAIKISGEQLMDELTSCKGKMPILESLNFSALRLSLERLRESDDYADDSRDIDSDKYDVFEIMPQLKSVKFQYENAFRRWVLPWSQLNKLDIIVTILFDVPTILQELRNIEELLINVSAGGTEDSTLQDLRLFDGFSVRLERMRVLQVPFPIILSWIVAPLLHELRLGDPSNRFYRTLFCREELLSLIHRSGPSCQIRRLVLRGDDIVAAEDIISTLVDVEELHICTPIRLFEPDIHSSKYVYSILTKLTNLDDHSYLPALRQLAIAFIPDKTVPALVKKVSRLLKSRSASTSAIAVVPLESLIIQIFKPGFSEAEAQLPDELIKAKRKWPTFVEVGFRKKIWY